MPTVSKPGRSGFSDIRFTKPNGHGIVELHQKMGNGDPVL